MDFLEFLSGWLSNIYAPLACLILIIYAAYTFQRYRAEIVAFERTLDSAAKTLAVAQSRASFREHFDEINHHLTTADNDIGSGAVGAAWREFEPTIIRDPDTGLSATRRPSDFFDARLFTRANIDLRAFESIPNQLVGIGLGLTFAGIVWSLVNAAPDISGGSVEAAQEALSTLLATASFKFSTSLFAIVASILFMVGKNKLLHRVDLKIDALCATIERCVDVQTADGLAARSLLQLEQQTKLLEFFKTDLAVSIGEAVNKAMAQEDTGAMSTVRKALEEMAKNLQGLNQDALAKMVEAFSTQLSGAAKAHVDELARLLALTADGLAKVPSAIDAAGEQFKLAVAAGSDELVTAMTAAGENLDAMFEDSAKSLVTGMDAAAARMDEGTRALLALSTEGMAAADKLRAVMDAAAAATVGLAGLAEQLVEAGEASGALTEVAAAMRETGAKLVAGIAGIEGLSEKTAEIAANAERTSALLAERMTVLNKESGGLNTALAGAFQKLGDGLGSFGEKTTKVVHDIDNNLASSVKALSGAIERFDELIEALPKRDDYAKLTSAITEAGRKAASPPPASNGAAE